MLLLKRFACPVKKLLLVLTFTMTASSGLAKTPDVIVTLFDTHPKPNLSQVSIYGNYQVVSPQSLPKQYLPNQLILKNTQQNISIYPQNNKKRITQVPFIRLRARDTKGICLLAIESNIRRCYLGTIQIKPEGNGLHIQNIVNKRQYVQSVISSETPAGWPLEALKAQSVLTQTRLRHKHVQHNLVSVSDSTTDEAYLGIRGNNRLAEKAVQESWGNYLSYQNRPIEAFYHSTCAGHTSDDGYFSNRKHPYSVGITCPYCKQSPFYKTHQSIVPRKRWKQVYPSPIKFSSLDNGKRYRLARYRNKDENAYAVWISIGRHFGWDKLPGTNFTIVEGKSEIMLQSRGAGHGIGLCQWGARQMALQGKNYHQILSFYYPKASFSKGL